MQLPCRQPLPMMQYGALLAAPVEQTRKVAVRQPGQTTNVAFPGS